MVNSKENEFGKFLSDGLKGDNFCSSDVYFGLLKKYLCLNLGLDLKDGMDIDIDKLFERFAQMKILTQEENLIMDILFCNLSYISQLEGTKFIEWKVDENNLEPRFAYKDGKVESIITTEINLRDYKVVSSIFDLTTVYILNKEDEVYRTRKPIAS